MGKTRFWIIVGLGSVLSFEDTISATTLMTVETSEVARAASWIGHIRVVSVNQPESGVALLNVEAEVVDVLKGDSQPGSRVSFRIPGGRVNGKAVDVMGFPQFKPNRDYLVFLDSAPSPRTGLSLQGSAVGLQNWTSYEISRSKTGERRALRGGSTGIARSTASGLRISHDTRERRLSDIYADVFRGLN